MPLRCARAKRSSGSRLPSTWMCSSLLGKRSISTSAAALIASLLILANLRRQLALDAFGEPVHAGDGIVLEDLAILHLDLARLILDRSLEDDDLAALDAFLCGLRRGCDIVRHVGVGRHDE